MARSQVDLDLITVASPCPVAWGDMTGDERKRFCNKCNLNVYNLSAMTKAEAESVITNTEGRVCARFYRRADGTVLTQDCPVGLRAIRKRASRATAAAFSALVSLFGGTATFAQPQQQPKDESKVEVQRTLRRYGQAAVEGTIFDILHMTIAGAEVRLINEQTKREIITKTNESGRFRVTDLEQGIYTIRVLSPGFKRLEQLGLNISDDQALNLNMTLKVGEIVGELILLPETIPTNDTIPSGELIRKDKPRG